ncbi:nifU-like protein 2, chloroplastic [Gossypium australe]|uniref:NifU-like protein 2, chloroplastic n=1 Tax=Gossypium australe TaxID=47621 RepID=A0A5B6WUU1_9ROSI|nr:nifU-like protein 2, chloroplastic [Gossypium australe]
MALNNYQWQFMRTIPTKAASVFNLDAVSMLSNQTHPVMQCDTRGGVANPEYPPYGYGMENEQAHYTGWRYHSNFSWDDQNSQRLELPPDFQQPPHQQEEESNLEEMLTKFIAASETCFQKVETKLEVLSQKLKDQIGQLTKLISEQLQESLPSNTETKTDLRTTTRKLTKQH